MAIAKDPGEVKVATKVPSEKKVQSFINGGGGLTTKNLDRGGEGLAQTKSIKLILTEDEMNTIKELRSHRQPLRGRKISISVHDWVVEAIHEKAEREKKKYNL